MAAFRESVAASFLFKFFIHSQLQLPEDVRVHGSSLSSALPAVPSVPSDLVSAAVEPERGVSFGIQRYDVPEALVEARGPATSHPDINVVGAPIQHASADLQVPVASCCCCCCRCCWLSTERFCAPVVARWSVSTAGQW